MKHVDDEATFSLRAYAEADWPGVFRIVHSVCAAGDTFCYPVAVTEDQARKIWLLAPPGHVTVAVDHEGRIVGTGHMGPNRSGPGAHVATASFMVEAGRRDAGIGRHLVEDALAWARRNGFDAMQFNAVAASNARAMALYRTLGFELIGTVPRGFRHPYEGFVGLHILYKALA